MQATRDLTASEREEEEDDDDNCRLNLIRLVYRFSNEGNNNNKKKNHHWHKIVSWGLQMAEGIADENGKQKQLLMHLVVAKSGAFTAKSCWLLAIDVHCSALFCYALFD